MGLPVFYASRDHIDADRGIITLTATDARHLTRSLRAREGDCLLIGDGIGTLYQAKLGSPMEEPVRCTVLSESYLTPEKPQVVLFQAMSKNQAMDETVARAAEAGASRVVPFTSRRSPVEAVRKSAGRLERWRTIARESSKVARRAWPLEVRSPLPGLPDEAAIRTVGECVILWEEEERRAFADSLPAEPPRSIGLVVGPEGGLEGSEVDVLRTLSARTASLGELNIRSQSAGSYAVIIARFHYGLLVPGTGADE
jgi:16S rRNA (uracil1498-N3)-methyltransferase